MPPEKRILGTRVVQFNRYTPLDYISILFRQEVIALTKEPNPHDRKVGRGLEAEKSYTSNEHTEKYMKICDSSGSVDIPFLDLGLGTYQSAFFKESTTAPWPRR